MPHLAFRQVRTIQCAHWPCTFEARGFADTKKAATGIAQQALTDHINETHDRDES